MPAPTSPIPAKTVKPLIKWVGGKGQLLPQFKPHFPKHFNSFIEPFVGGGAVFFHLLPEKAVLIDNNPELINFYLVVRDQPVDILNDLQKHINAKEYYYQVRACNPDQMDPVGRASRFLFLNKTAYNGLWRVNKKGRHNVPFGRYKNPKYLDEENLDRVSTALKKADILLGDFGEALRFARAGDFIYLDPPYHPLSDTACFTSYTPHAFGEKEEMRLAEVFRSLNRRGCFLMLSNSDSPFVRELYQGFDIQVVYAKRAINCRSDRRGPITELVIRNYI